MMSSVWLELAIRYGHFIGILMLTSTLVAQNILLKPELVTSDSRRLISLDALYGLSAVLTLSAGLSLWFWVGKGSAFYSQNPVFLLKMALFAGIGLMSLIPTRFFLTLRRNQATAVTVPRHIRRIKRLELLLLPTVPALAVLMARGVGLSA